jgi:hypothetical protein
VPRPPAPRRDADAKAAAEKREAERRSAAEAAREKSMRQAVEKVEQRLAAGDFVRARRELDRALGEHGEATRLGELAARLAEAESSAAVERQRAEREAADRQRAAALEASTGSAVPSGSFASPGSSMTRSGRRVAGLAAAAGVAGVALVSWLVFGRGESRPPATAPGTGATLEPARSSPGSEPATTPAVSPAVAPPGASPAAPENLPAPIRPEADPAPVEVAPRRPVETAPSPPAQREPEPVRPEPPVVERPAPVEAPPVTAPTGPRPEPEPAIESRPEPVAPPPAEVRPEPTPVEDPTAGVRAALERYRAAYQALDAAAVKSAWPGLDAAAQRQVARAFEGYHSIAMSISDCRYEVDGDRATARCRVTQTIDVKVGRDLESTQDVVFGLRRAGAGWTITERTAR